MHKECKCEYKEEGTSVYGTMWVAQISHKSDSERQQINAVKATKAKLARNEYWY